MALTVNDYRLMLAQLLPPSSIIVARAGSMLASLLDALSVEMQQCDAKAYALMNEVDPRQAIDLLTDWERLLGLPTACTPLQNTIQGRRNAAWLKLIGRGGQSAAYFVALAAGIGETVTVQTYRPFEAGSAQAGDAVNNGSGWAYSFGIAAAATTMRQFVAGSYAGDALRQWNNPALECAINADKPAHVQMVFYYI